MTGSRQNISHNIQLDEILQIAIIAAEKAARCIEQNNDPQIIHFKSSLADIESNADKKAEELIVKTIQCKRPGDGVLGEEGSNIDSKNGLRWVIDSLDGSTNYVYRTPHWAISIACEKYTDEAWQAIVAVAYDICRNELFTAKKDHGSYLNGKKIKVNNTKELMRAIVATGFSYQIHERCKQVEQLSSVLAHVRDTRCSGSTVLDLCWVAAGRLDACYEDTLHRWDWSAGKLLVEEAGGVVTQFGNGVIAGNSKLHKKLQLLLEVII